MSEESSNATSDTIQDQKEEEYVEKAIDVKENAKESKLASLAKKSRPFKGDKNVKKDKPVDPVVKFTEGVFFKAKIIGLEDVPDARGDKMCQISLQRLKAVVKNSGTHKTKVTVCVSIEGLKIREERTADLLYHHPVHRISFIAQDAADSRAFGYIYGSPDMGHKFYALKTEKAASMIVIAMRDLFQVVYDMKKQEIDVAREHKRTLDEQELAGTLPQDESSPDSPQDQLSPEQDSTVNDLLDLQYELDNLWQGISHMNTSISAVEVTKSQEELDKLIQDPFGDSFIKSPQIQVQKQPTSNEASMNAVPLSGLLPPPQITKGASKGTEELADVFSIPPPKPAAPNQNATNSTNPFNDTTSDDFFSLSTGLNTTGLDNILSPERTPSPYDEQVTGDDGGVDVLAALDPLGTGTNKPFVDRREFFKDSKAPKKTLKDLRSSSHDVSMSLCRNPFDVQSEDDVSSPPLPPRLNPNAGQSDDSSGVVCASQVKSSADRWVNFDTSPPEVPPPPPPISSDCVPPTPPPRPAVTLCSRGITPPLPKREKFIGPCPNPFTSPLREPRNSSDAGYDSYDDPFENVGTSPSSTSSPPSSPPIPIPARRTHPSHLRHSPLVYNLSSSVSNRSVVALPPPPQTSHSFPASRVSSLPDSVLSTSGRSKTPESVVATSSTSSVSNQSTPDTSRRKFSASQSVSLSEYLSPQTSIVDPVSNNAADSSSESSESHKLEEVANSSSDRYAAIEDLERGDMQTKFESIFDFYAKRDEDDKNSESDEDCGRVENAGQKPINLTLQLLQPRIKEDPFVVSPINPPSKNLPLFASANGGESTNNFEVDFEANFDSSNVADESPVENSQTIADENDLKRSVEFDCKFESPMDTADNDPFVNNLGTSTQTPLESTANGKNTFGSDFNPTPDEEVKCESAIESLHRQKRVDELFSPFGDGDAPKDISKSEDALSPISYLNSKDIFRRDEDPFDDEFFQTNDRVATTNLRDSSSDWASKSFEDFKFDA